MSSTTLTVKGGNVLEIKSLGTQGLRGPTGPAGPIGPEGPQGPPGTGGSGGGGSTDWVDITGKPSTFPPDPHVHDYSTLTGIPSTFPPSAHVHDYATLTNIPATFPPSTHTHPESDILLGATARILGRVSAGAGIAEELTGTDVTALLDSFTLTLKGLVAPPGTATGKFLRDDNSWAVPSGGAGGTVPISSGGTGQTTAYAAYDALKVHGADIASAATVNLDAATGDLIDITGTTAITAITLSEGRERTVRFTGVLILTHSANLVIPGSVNRTTANGDCCTFRGYAGGVVRCTAYSKINVTGSGSLVHQTNATLITPVIGAATGTSVVLTGSATVGASNSYLFSGRGGLSSTADGAFSLLANDGTTGASLTFATYAGISGVCKIGGTDAGSFWPLRIAYASSGVLQFTRADGNVSWLEIAGNVGQPAFQYGITIGKTVGSTPDVFLLRHAANSLALRNSTSAQELRISNTYANSGTDHETGLISWQTTANVLTIGTIKAGTGSTRNIEFIVGGTRTFDYGITNASSWTASGDIYASNLRLSGYSLIGAAGLYYFNTRGEIGAPADGIFLLRNAATTGFTGIKLGGTTSSFPYLRVRSATLETRLADDSAIATHVHAMVLKAGAVSDSDFTNPVSGCFGYDTSNKKFYVRNGSTWESSAAFT